MIRSYGRTVTQKATATGRTKKTDLYFRFSIIKWRLRFCVDIVVVFVLVCTEDRIFLG